MRVVFHDVGPRFRLKRVRYEDRGFAERRASGLVGSRVGTRVLGFGFVPGGVYLILKPN